MQRLPVEGRFTRRTFLAAGVGLAVASACGGDDDGTTATATSTRPSTTLRPVNQPSELDVVVAAPQLVARVDQRITIGVFRNGEPLPAGEPLQVGFGREYGETSTPEPAEFHNQGIESRPYYLTHFRFDEPGTWVLEATAGDRTGGAALRVVPAGEVEVPLPGERLLPVATPTTEDSRGVDPICTRKPPCALHEVSLDRAIEAGRPLAVLFSTPALCTSRVCGPVLDILLDELPSASSVQGVHVEVWKSLDTDFKADDLTDGMRAYHLVFEPVLFLAGADGGIRERLDGPFDRLEAHAALARLTA